VNNAEVIKGLASRLNLTHAESKATIQALIDVVTEGLTEQGKVTINGLGTLEVVERKARVGRNPKTGGTVDVPAKNVVRVKGKENLLQAIQ